MNIINIYGYLFFKNNTISIIYIDSDDIYRISKIFENISVI